MNPLTEVEDLTSREEYRARVRLALAVLSHRGDHSPLCVVLERVLLGMPLEDLADGERR